MSERTCLVTGANSGLGLATAIELARRGHRVTGTVRSEEKAGPLHEAADEAGVSVEHRLLDVVDAERGAEVIDEIRPDALVNNAGYGMSAPVELVEDADASHIVETMLMAPIRLARLAIPHQREHGGGHVIMISSILGRITTPMTGWYQGAKHGLEAVSDALRQEVAGDGIHVVLVEPGFFRTNIFDDIDRDAARYAGQGYDDAFDRARQTLERSTWAMGDPDAVAKTVAKAIENSRPRARYLVGPDALAMDVLNPLVPTMIRDRMARLAYGL